MVSAERPQRVERLACLVQPSVPATASLATDRHLLAAVGDHDTSGGLLRIFACPGDVLLAGRWHLAPAGSEGLGAGFGRRLSGGRAWPFGSGYLGVSLILPHRSALVADEPFALTPSQVPNRYVRGLMRALEQLGMAPVYPGRDLVTVGRRPLATVSFEIDAAGRLVLEMLLAVDRPLGFVAQLLDRYDPDGTISVDLPALEHGTCVREEIGRVPAVEELAAHVGAGFAAQFGVAIQTARLTVEEERAITRVAHEHVAWGQSRAHRAALRQTASARTQLGVLAVSIAITSERTLADVMLAGDFIANSAAIVALEERLRGCPIEPRALTRVIDGVFSEPGNFILGIGPTRTIAETIMRSVPR